MGVLDGVHVPQGEGEVLGCFVPIGLNGIFLNRNVFDSSVKSCSLAFRRNNKVRDQSWGL